MQLFAYDKSAIVYSESASKKVTYFCPQCEGELRLKKGLHRRPHFFHIHRPKGCRQGKKSLFHQMIQKFLLSLLPQEECALEKRFLSIGRIADFVWESKKWVFEVQCSFITLDEVKNRIKDYQKIGYRVFWILHDRRFNRQRMSPAEFYLRKQQAAFFTSMNAQGEGIFYDQYERFFGHQRLERGQKIPINLYLPKISKPILVNKQSSITWKKRLKNDFFLYCKLFLKILIR